ncbi:TPA: acetyl-CoA carboxylase biotin carboxyl carrier protein [Streptococcus agalactiae]|uniref:Biotin carboxyl carrier protein of acetyl-CoA carboxylase n=2 Tax=Streptococcus agalactiae TaxID=1311 RepID=A0AAW6XXN2_STRAG|nr:acetyl-CoA carboxylase biotin carboxyl carrier protein [Streptococcus agalactiae]EPT72001.1 acetyl-CoA carboxylase biotin carboxyl carrier protein subunit [Streptococcus agalactiae CCUG 38383]EPT89806.1 acetyl-CoA carboxylase biotin carboxyl carrier protein subunit [Streptococcus agalactiae BSU188]EPU52117.1 acetyl-CoA carboxylase biotin carboxyl carrier protein subunit [Streptococcus agalactiae GB00002]EPU58990.1 acetyl-CoA carboxylase biotin carboxyl carrier protein subunit [Streptococcus 
MQFWPSNAGRIKLDIQEIKDLMTQFDESSLREFSFKTSDGELSFSKNEGKAPLVPTMSHMSHQPEATPTIATPVSNEAGEQTKQATEVVSEIPESTVTVAEGDVVESPLVGVAYLASGPDKPNFVSVGDSVKKGQTLMIIEAMKVMNEVPAPHDGVVTEILVANEEVIEFGKGLVRIK